jgi:acyl-homoserine-lactone acylase
MPHATEMLEGDYSPLHGAQRTARSPRTRENAVVLGDTSADGPSGEDGFTLDELADAALQNHGYTSRALLDDVVARCRGVATVDVPALASEQDGVPGLPAEPVDITGACDVLARWDGVYDLDRAGPVVWREALGQFGFSDLTGDGPLWAEPFDPARPVDTPTGLAAPPPGQPDPVLVNLARAVQILDLAGIPVDAPLGDVQFARRDGETIPIHGGDSTDGTTNIVGYNGSVPVLDPALVERDHEPVAPDSSLARDGGDTGYVVNNGTSFLLALELTEEGPRAKVFLTYGNTEDRGTDAYSEATERFSAKEWRDVAFADDDVEAVTIDVKTVRG